MPPPVPRRVPLGIVLAAKNCHSEEQSDEESFLQDSSLTLRMTKERSFAVAQDDGKDSHYPEKAPDDAVRGCEMMQSSIFNKLLSAFGTCDGNFSLSLGNPDLLMTAGAVKIAVIPILHPL